MLNAFYISFLRQIYLVLYDLFETQVYPVFSSCIKYLINRTFLNKLSDIFISLHINVCFVIVRHNLF